MIYILMILAALCGVGMGYSVGSRVACLKIDFSEEFTDEQKEEIANFIKEVMRDETSK